MNAAPPSSKSTQRLVPSSAETRAEDLERRRELGQFFTPPLVAGFIWEMLEIIHGGRFSAGTQMIDPACGEGIFLCVAAGHGLPAQSLFGVDIDEKPCRRRVAGNCGRAIGIVRRLLCCRAAQFSESRLRARNPGSCQMGLCREQQRCGSRLLGVRTVANPEVRRAERGGTNPLPLARDCADLHFVNGAEDLFVGHWLC
jgi:hypothetical protein